MRTHAYYSKRRSRRFYLAILLSFGLFYTDNVQSNLVKIKEETANTFRIKAYSIKSTFYNLGIRLCETIAHTQLACEVEPSKGSVENAKDLLDKNIQAAFISTLTYYQIQKNQEPFEGYSKADQLSPLSHSCHQLILPIPMPTVTLKPLMMHLDTLSIPDIQAVL